MLNQIVDFVKLWWDNMKDTIKGTDPVKFFSEILETSVMKEFRK